MPPKSRSGVIRKAIAPVRSRLIEYNTTVTEQFLVDVSGLTAQDCQTLLDDIQEISAKIRASIATLTDRDNQWQALITNLDEAAATDEEDLYGTVALQDETGYLLVLERSKELLCSLDRKRSEADRHLVRRSATATTTGGTPSERTVGASKLPKLTLPTFGGDYLEWQNFWQIFKVNVHDQNISGVEKFAYLRTLLSGPALHAIDGLSINDINYNTAVDILRDRFLRSPSQLVGTLYSQLKRLPSATASVKSLTDTYDSLEKIFRQLETTGEAVDANRSLVLDVLSKYPPDVVKDLMKRQNVDTDSSLKDVRGAIRKYIKQSEDIADMLDDLHPFDVSKSSRSKPESTRPRHLEQQFDTGSRSIYTSTSAFAAASTPVNNSPKRTVPGPPSPCYFCSGAHLNNDCTKYTTAEQKRARLRELKRCFRCLRPDHQQSQCHISQQSLRCFSCKALGQHATALCPQRFRTTPLHDGRPATGVNEENNGNSTLLNTNEQALLLTATTQVFNPETKSTINVRIIFDTGSHRSYITNSCVAALELQTAREEPLHVSIFGTKRTLTVGSQLVSLGIHQRDGSTRVINAHTIPMITDCNISPTRLPSIDLSSIQAMQLDLADSYDNTNTSIDILIGSDYFWEFMTGSPVETSAGLYLIPSTVGLLVSGRYKDVTSHDESPQPALLCLTETYSRIPLECGLTAVATARVPDYPDVDEYWSLEKIGICDDPMVKDDDRALDHFNETVIHDGDRYQVRWPWRDNCVNLPSNVELATGRCISLGKRLTGADPEVRIKYQDVIDDQMAKGVIERVPENEVDPNNCPHPVHYLPHHPVVKLTSTTTKVRIVYDASSKTRKDNPSLNECLYRGPVLLPDLCAILIRFRTYPVAMVADVEKAFLQMGLQMPDRDVTRFLWFDSDGSLIHLRFRRVPFGVVSSPFLLGAVIQYHLRRTNTWVAQLMRPNIYVDNIICGVDDSDKAKEMYIGAKEIFQSAGMNLQQWCSNAEEVMSSIPPDDLVASRDIKLLGLQWDIRDDTLRLRNNLDASTVNECRTKRAILQAVASIYDPLGLFQPVLLRAKCFLHKLWDQGKSWDADIGHELQNEWRAIYDDVIPIFSQRIDRHPDSLVIDSAANIVIFCDASKLAYAAAAYLRTWDYVGQTWMSTLICAKSRLAPKTKSSSQLSMPRLELLGLTIGARLARFVREALLQTHILPVYLFTDSMCVLHWVRTSKPLSVFVDNRVREVLRLDNSEVLYVRTSDNPADINTRGKSAIDLQHCVLWWRGPTWLGQSRPLWSVRDGSTIDSEPSTEMSAEYRKDSMPITSLLAGEGSVPEKIDDHPLTIDPESYSSFRKLQHVTAWCLRFIRVQVWDFVSDKNRTSLAAGVRNMFEVATERYLTCAELAQAKRVWVTYAQRLNYRDVLEAVRLGKSHSLIKQLGVGIDDDGILRCYGRFDHSDLSTEAIQPKLLPKDSLVTEMIIRDVHERMFHTGVGHTLSQLRREYWIPHGRNAVRKVLSRCIICRKHKGAPFALPKMPPWPRERVSRSSPFRFTGLDYFGPVTGKVAENSQKMWVCLFTCLAVRAIHLEWVGDCSAKEFLECLIRFVSRRGAPEQIISDNAPQFRVTKAAIDKIWAHVLQDETVQSYAATSGIMWKFTTELAPWQGGFYERLVGIVKGSFKAAIGRRMLPWGEFVTLCSEVEAIANSRPITYVYGELNSGPALRPVDFLTDLSVGLPVSDRAMPLDGLGDAGRNLLRYWKLKQGRLDSLWKFWYGEYLLSLRERGQSQHRARKGEIHSSPAVNQVVLVRDADVPRGAWKLARVLRIVPSGDGSIRSVELLLPNNLTIRRALNHLYPLEVEPHLNPGQTPQDGSANDHGVEADFHGFTEAECDEVERRVMGIGAVQQSFADNLNTVAFTVNL